MNNVVQNGLTTFKDVDVGVDDISISTMKVHEVHNVKYLKQQWIDCHFVCQMNIFRHGGRLSCFRSNVDTSFGYHGSAGIIFMHLQQICLIVCGNCVWAVPLSK